LLGVIHRIKALNRYLGENRRLRRHLVTTRVAIFIELMEDHLCGHARRLGM
jgi:hypothetical protein